MALGSTRVKKWMREKPMEELLPVDESFCPCSVYPVGKALRCNRNLQNPLCFSSFSDVFPSLSLLRKPRVETHSRQLCSIFPSQHTDNLQAGVRQRFSPRHPPIFQVGGLFSHLISYPPSAGNSIHGVHRHNHSTTITGPLGPHINLPGQQLARDTILQ
jgi:hypothetical protein